MFEKLYIKVDDDVKGFVREFWKRFIFMGEFSHFLFYLFFIDD